MNRKYYWASSARFLVGDGGLRIEGTVYGEEAASLFPAFYYLMQDGATMRDLAAAFPGMPEEELGRWVFEWQKRGFLSSAPEPVDQVFYPQARFYAGKANIMLDGAEKTEAFQKKSLFRRVHEGEVTPLEEWDAEGLLKTRSSVRRFSAGEVPMDSFSAVLGVLSARAEEGRSMRYYPTAGGLAPVDVYVYVKENRVEDLDAGLYYYFPQGHSLVSLWKGERISADSQFPSNQEIFLTSAFTVYFFYNADCSMPKYGSRGYFYGIVDSGIMAELVTMAAEKGGLGSCIIGDQPFEAVEALFPVGRNQKFLFSMELGRKEGEKA